MWNSGRKFPPIIALALFSLIALAAGCKGFFVNQPNSISVTTGLNGSGATTFSVAQGGTQQLYATATFNSGSKDITKSAFWQSSSPCATVNVGLVKGVGSISSVTITATLGGVSGSATGGVAGSGGQTLTTTSTPAGPTFTHGTTAQFFASLNGSDVTNSTTWTSSNTAVVTFSSNMATFVNTGSATITASLVSGTSCASGSEAITVQ